MSEVYGLWNTTRNHNVQSKISVSGFLPLLVGNHGDYLVGHG